MRLKLNITNYFNHGAEHFIQSYIGLYLYSLSIECIDGHNACPYRVKVSNDTFPVKLGTCTLSVLRVVHGLIPVSMMREWENNRTYSRIVRK